MTLEGAKPPFLRRVRIRGYKSIAFCDVALEPLTILVGRNGSGKSNFVDALAFLRDVVVLGASEAVRRHGGRGGILHRGADSTRVSIEVEVAHTSQEGEADRGAAQYAMEVDLPEDAAPRLVSERMRFGGAGQGDEYGYDWDSDGNPPTPFPDGLRGRWLQLHETLARTDGVQHPYIDVFSRIRSLTTYNFDPEAIRRPQEPMRGQRLDRDGWNLASVIETTRGLEPWAVERAGQYLAVIVPSTHFAGVLSSGGYETLRFRVTPDGGDPKEFNAKSMSDGTLRAFATVMAAFQQTPEFGSPALVAIEEPETGLHPAAMPALLSALDEATLRTQVLVTTHSPDLLDAEEVTPENVRVVRMIDGRTVIGRVDEASVDIAGEKLNTLGGMERYDQLGPHYDDLEQEKKSVELTAQDSAR